MHGYSLSPSGPIGLHKQRPDVARRGPMCWGTPPGWQRPCLNVSAVFGIERGWRFERPSGQLPAGRDASEVAGVLSLWSGREPRASSRPGPAGDSPAGGNDADDAGQRADRDEWDFGDRSSRGNRGWRDPSPCAIRRDDQTQRPCSDDAWALLESTGLRPAGAVPGPRGVRLLGAGAPRAWGQ